MPKPLKVKIDVLQTRQGWTTTAVFSGGTAVDLKGDGATLPEALRELADNIELCFEHMPEQAEG